MFSQRLGDPSSVVKAVIAFVVFCALSGAVYLINDVLDREQDRRHPLKAKRAIAAGTLSVRVAVVAAIVLAAGASIVAFALGLPFFAVSAAYLILQVAYSGFLKHIVILDVLTIAAGFTLRAVAGGAAIMVPVSHWLVLCTTLLALFLALIFGTASGIVGARSACVAPPTPLNKKYVLGSPIRPLMLVPKQRLKPTTTHNSVITPSEMKL